MFFNSNSFHKYRYIIVQPTMFGWRIDKIHFNSNRNAFGWDETSNSSFQCFPEPSKLFEKQLWNHQQQKYEIWNCFRYSSLGTWHNIANRDQSHDQTWCVTDWMSNSNHDDNHCLKVLTDDNLSFVDNVTCRCERITKQVTMIQR